MPLLTDGLRRGGAGRGEALGEVDVAHVAAAAAEVVGAVLDLRRQVGHHAAVHAAALLVARVGPATWRGVGEGRAQVSSTDTNPTGVFL